MRLIGCLRIRFPGSGLGGEIPTLSTPRFGSLHLERKAAGVTLVATSLRRPLGQPHAACAKAKSMLAKPPPLDRLEAEAIHILREVAATFAKPVMLYSVGKDS